METPKELVKEMAKARGTKRSNGDESDEDQDCKGKPTCCYCHMEGHMVWNCQSMKRGEPPVPKERTETTANGNDDTITARDWLEITTTIEKYCVTDTGGKAPPANESWYLDWASSSHICGD